jgi:hypothetical protein
MGVTWRTQKGEGLEMCRTRHRKVMGASEDQVKLHSFTEINHLNTNEEINIPQKRPSTT